MPRLILLFLLLGALSAARLPAETHGRVTARITFPTDTPVGRREPLVASADGQDVLYVWYSGKNEVRIGFHHLGAGGPVSQPIAILPGQTSSLELNLGCFYPSPGDPAFAAWPADRIAQVHRRLFVSLDRRLVLNHESEFFPTGPAGIHFGENPGPYVAPGRFRGRIEGIQYQGIPQRASLATDTAGGPIRLTLRFPAFTRPGTEALASSGRPQAGELLYVIYTSPGWLRFGHDSWAGGAIESINLPYEADIPQTVEFELPSLSTADPGQAEAPFVLRYNGELVLATNRPRHATTNNILYLGLNRAGSTATSASFSGEIERAESIPSVSRDPGNTLSGTGPVRLVLRLPAEATGRSEPLLITGRSGAADIVFVRYTDQTHIQVGYDHWGAGGPLSPPIPVDYGTAQTFDLELGSLVPPPGDPAWGSVPAADQADAAGTIRIRLNGRTVLEHRANAYPAAPGELLVGVNSVGASTCGPAFTGYFLRRQRTGLVAPRP